MSREYSLGVWPSHTVEAIKYNPRVLEARTIKRVKNIMRWGWNKTNRDHSNFNRSNQPASTWLVKRLFRNSSVVAVATLRIRADGIKGFGVDFSLFFLGAVSSKNIVQRAGLSSPQTSNVIRKVKGTSKRRNKIQCIVLHHIHTWSEMKECKDSINLEECDVLKQFCFIRLIKRK